MFVLEFIIAANIRLFLETVLNFSKNLLAAISKQFLIFGKISEIEEKQV